MSQSDDAARKLIADIFGVPEDQVKSLDELTQRSDRTIKTPVGNFNPEEFGREIADRLGVDPSQVRFKGFGALDDEFDQQFDAAMKDQNAREDRTPENLKEFFERLGKGLHEEVRKNLMGETSNLTPEEQEAGAKAIQERGYPTYGKCACGQSMFTCDARANAAESNAQAMADGIDQASVIRNMEAMVMLSHGVSVMRGWHGAKEDGKTPDIPKMIALCHSELSEALEGDRKDKMDDHLPHRKAFDVELADLLHRVFDLAGATGADLAGAFYEKAIYNLTRPDHSPENRAAAGGKKY